MLGDTEKFTGVCLGWRTERAESKGKKHPLEAFDHSQIMP
jgi:hypothetical protein